MKITNGQRLNQSCLCHRASIKTLNEGVWRTSRLMDFPCAGRVTYPRLHGDRSFCALDSSGLCPVCPLLEYSFLFFIINHSNKQRVSLGSGNHSSELWNPRRMKQPQKSSRKRGTRGYLVQAGKLKKAGLCSQRMQLVDSVQQLTGYIF